MIIAGETFCVGLDWLKGLGSLLTVPDEETIVGIEVGVDDDELVSMFEVGVGDGAKVFAGTVRGTRESARYIFAFDSWRRIFAWWY
jgi:hypothetical protein